MGLCCHFSRDIKGLPGREQSHPQARHPQGEPSWWVPPGNGVPQLRPFGPLPSTAGLSRGPLPPGREQPARGQAQLHTHGLHMRQRGGLQCSWAGGKCGSLTICPISLSSDQRDSVPPVAGPAATQPPLLFLPGWKGHSDRLRPDWFPGARGGYAKKQSR